MSTTRLTEAPEIIRAAFENATRPHGISDKLGECGCEACSLHDRATAFLAAIPICEWWILY